MSARGESPSLLRRPNFTAAKSNRNGGISNCNVIRQWWRKREKEGEREAKQRGGGDDAVGGWRTRRRDAWAKDKECGSQGVTRISFDGITWRLRVGTVITLVVYT